MEWNRVETLSNGIGVDRDNPVIRGYVIAQEGHFKSKGRGQFDLQSLRSIVSLASQKPAGLKSRLSHPTLLSDGIGKFLGRARNLRLDSNGAKVSAVRGDLHLDPTSFKTPNGNLGEYVLSLAESDPDAFSSSLVLAGTQEQVLDPRGRRQTDAKGEPVPSVWRPTELHVSDVVDTGDAVDGFLSIGSGSMSIGGLPDSAVRQAAQLLSNQFRDITRDELQGRLRSWLDKYLNWRFHGECKPTRTSQWAVRDVNGK